MAFATIRGYLVGWIGGWVGASGFAIGRGLERMAGKLTALKIKALTAPGRYGDGAGLWLQVRDAEHRSWLFRYTRLGRAREMGLGPFSDVPLIEARALAAECRRDLRAGLDPLEKRRAARAEEAAKVNLTFGEVAEQYHAAHQAGWRNYTHRTQWLSQMRRYVFPSCGSLPVERVGTGDVLKALEPIWHVRPSTASVQRGRIEAVLDYARARDWRTGENPARWRGHLSKLLPSLSRIVTVQHHPALPHVEVGAFVAELKKSPDLAALALELLILTVVRTKEAMKAEWAEFDMAERVWTIPAARMKASKHDHRVHLSAAALDVLGRIRARQAELGRYVFPSPLNAKAPMSNRACAMLLRRMNPQPEDGSVARWVDPKGEAITVHGFRSTFRDWVAERTSFPREIGELALAHTVGSAVERAYQRSELLAKRAQLMEAWGRYCGQPVKGGEVVSIRGRNAVSNPTL